MALGGKYSTRTQKGQVNTVRYYVEEKRNIPEVSQFSPLNVRALLDRDEHLSTNFSNAAECRKLPQVISLLCDVGVAKAVKMVLPRRWVIRNSHNGSRLLVPS